MSLALSSFAPQSQAAEWLPLAAAAETDGRSADHLSRLCKEKFCPEGRAELRLCAGGPPKWFIHRSCLTPVQGEPIAPANKTPDISKLSENQRVMLGLRMQCVARYRRIHHDKSLRNYSKAQWAAAVVAWARESFADFSIAVRTLRRWDQKFPVESDLAKLSESDLAKLIDRRGGDRRSQGDPAAWQAFRSLYCDPRQPTIAHVYKLVRGLAKENDWAWPKRCPRQREVDSHIPPDVQLFNRDHARWAKTQSPYIRQHSEAWGAGERYVTDHKNLDLFCRYKGRVIRPWLTTFMDWRTRKITGFALSENPCTDTIISALRMAIKDPSNKGGPREILCDNGRDYRSEAMTGQTNAQRLAAKSRGIDDKQIAGKYGLLGIVLHLANKRSPNSKSRQERFFGRFGEFSRHFATYTGYSSETKPEGLNKILADGRAIPSFDEVARRLGDFIRAYNSAEHGIEDLAEHGVKLSPSEAYSRWAGTVTRNLDENAIDVILRGPHPRASRPGHGRIHSEHPRC
ncbi:MAG: DNA-binding domain-containing protein [Tepidisphaeraceae bacterium]